jgi:hypothetical protein
LSNLLARSASVIAIAGIALTTIAVESSATTAQPHVTCSIPSSRDITITRSVYSTGKSLGVSDKVMLAGFEAGWVESHMNNLNCGDRASLGVFQQQVGLGWGTAEEIMNPVHAAAEFFNRAKANEPKFVNDTAGHLAQSVQISCCPDRYDQVQSTAQALLNEVKSMPATGMPFDNAMNTSGVWSGAATVNTTQATQVVSATTDNGDLHIDTLVNGQVYDNIRPHGSTQWLGPQQVPTPPNVSGISAAGTKDGDFHLFTLVGGNVWHNTRFNNTGSWTGAVEVDSAGRTSAIAAAGTTEGDIHLATLANGTIWHNTMFLHTDGHWTGSVEVDPTGNANAIALAATPDGDLHLFSVANGNIWHNTMFLHTDGHWTGGVEVDDSGRASTIAATATKDRNLHLMNISNGTIWHNTMFLSSDGHWSGTVEVDKTTHTIDIAATGTTDGSLQLVNLG